MKNFIIYILFLFTSFSSFSNDNLLKICLTGSTENAIPNYAEAFFNGAKLAFSELSEADKNKVQLIYKPHDSTPLAPINKLNELRNDACDAIVGFSTGNDLLSIEENLKKFPLFTLSIYGDPQARFNQTTYLRTMQPSPEDLTLHLLSKIKINSKRKVLMITAIDRSEMTSYREAFLKHLKNSKLTQIEVLEQAKDLGPLKSLLLKDRQWDYVILLTRSVIAAEASDIIHQYATPILLGTKYMGSPELPAFYNYLKNKKVTAFFSRQNCTCSENPDYQKVVKKYSQMFSIQPMAISVDTYDAVKFILQARLLKKINQASVIKFLNSDVINYLGPSSLKVLPGLDLKVMNRFLMKIDESGYKEVK